MGIERQIYQRVSSFFKICPLYMWYPICKHKMSKDWPKNKRKKQKQSTSKSFKNVYLLQKHWKNGNSPHVSGQIKYSLLKLDSALSFSEIEYTKANYAKFRLSYKLFSLRYINQWSTESLITETFNYVKNFQRLYMVLR